MRDAVFVWQATRLRKNYWRFDSQPWLVGLSRSSCRQKLELICPSLEPLLSEAYRVCLGTMAVVGLAKACVRILDTAAVIALSQHMHFKVAFQIAYHLRTSKNSVAHPVLAGFVLCFALRFLLNFPTLSRSFASPQNPGSGLTCLLKIVHLAIWPRSHCSSLTCVDGVSVHHESLVGVIERIAAPPCDVREREREREETLRWYCCTMVRIPLEISNEYFHDVK